MLLKIYLNLRKCCVWSRANVRKSCRHKKSNFQKLKDNIKEKKTFLIRAIINSVEQRISDELNLLPNRKEGINQAKWALLDYGDVIINVFQPKEREYYELESFWSNGKLYKHQSDQID